MATLRVSRKAFYKSGKDVKIRAKSAVVATGDESASNAASPSVRDTRKQSVTQPTENVSLDDVTLFQIYRESNSRIDVYASRIREGVGVLEASDFARWLQFSGIVKLIEANSIQKPFVVDGRALRKKTEDLIYECGEWFRLHENSNLKPDPAIPRTELERINASLATITQTLATLSPPKSETPAVGQAPALRVIDGGVS